MGAVEGKAAIIDRPVEDVWRFIVDISNMPKWEDARAEWNQTSEGPINVGTIIRSSFNILRRQFKYDLRIAEFEPNRKFTIEALNGFGRGTKISYVMEPIEHGKTRLSRVTEMKLHGFAKVLRPFQASIVRRTGRKEANNVKRLLEVGAEDRSSLKSNQFS